MKSQFGECIVGFYLQYFKNCDLILYNFRPPEKKLLKIDVVGVNLDKKIVFMCDVSTHINGILYKNGKKDTIKTIEKKFNIQKEYANNHLKGFDCHYMLWSPVVPEGVKNGLQHLKDSGLELVINEEYMNRFRKLEKVLGDYLP